MLLRTFFFSNIILVLKFRIIYKELLVIKILSIANLYIIVHVLEIIHTKILLVY